MAPSGRTTARAKSTTRGPDDWLIRLMVIVSLLLRGCFIRNYIATITNQPVESQVFVTMTGAKQA
jgi:hypothetical protein